MKNVITISGQHGSGRKELGEMIASRLGIPFYGDNLAAMIADEGGVDLAAGRILGLAAVVLTSSGALRALFLIGAIMVVGTM